jgi:hypothetical protein
MDVPLHPSIHLRTPREWQPFHQFVDEPLTFSIGCPSRSSAHPPYTMSISTFETITSSRR